MVHSSQILSPKQPPSHPPDENTIFLFVVHPYDVGDSLLLGGQQYRVTDVSLVGGQQGRLEGAGHEFACACGGGELQGRTQPKRGPQPRLTLTPPPPSGNRITPHSLARPTRRHAWDARLLLPSLHPSRSPSSPLLPVRNPPKRSLSYTLAAPPCPARPVTGVVPQRQATHGALHQHERQRK